MKNQNGITLIALVITIIVLLILAGVSIAMLSGDNGLLTQAKNVETQSKAGNLEEATKLAVAEILLVNNGTISGNLTADTVVGETRTPSNFNTMILAQNPDLGTVSVDPVTGTDAEGNDVNYLKVATADATVFVSEAGAVYKYENDIKTALNITVADPE